MQTPLFVVRTDARVIACRKSLKAARKALTRCKVRCAFIYFPQSAINEENNRGNT